LLLSEEGGRACLKIEYLPKPINRHLKMHQSRRVTLGEGHFCSAKVGQLLPADGWLGGGVKLLPLRKAGSILA